jgi:hypothetical protein
LRRLRIAAPTQLPLDLDGVVPMPAERWSALPETARDRVLVLLAGLIARGVVEKEEQPND